MTLKDAQARIAQLEERIKTLEKQLHMERKNGDSVREILATFKPAKEKLGHTMTTKSNRGHKYDRHYCHYCKKEFAANRKAFHGGGRCVAQWKADKIDAKRVLDEATP